MMGLVCQFDPRQHYVLRGCVARAIGRVVPKRVRGHLFLYWHRVTRNYVVGLWQKKGRLFQDVLNLGGRLPAMYQVSRDVARMYEWNPTPLWKEMAGKESDRLHRQNDESAALTDDWEWRRASKQRCRVALGK